MLNRLCYIGTNRQMLTRRGKVQSGDFVLIIPKKRFTRIKRIVQGWNKQMEENIDKEIINERFESFYSANQISVAKLADRYVKNLF